MLLGEQRLADAGYWSEANAETETAEAELLIATRKDHRQQAARRDLPSPRGRMPSDLTPRQSMERKLLTKRGRDLLSRPAPASGEEAKKNNEAARLWISGIETVKKKLGLNAVYDLSATPFFLRGSGYVEGTLFPWTVSDFSLTFSRSAEPRMI